MAEENKSIALTFLSVVLFIIVLFLFVVSIEQNYWLALPAIFYFVFFFFREGDLKSKELDGRLRIKDLSEKRFSWR